jgi:hypothetical protein
MMAPPSQELEPPANPERFNSAKIAQLDWWRVKEIKRS